jgi:hypothetical protein
MLLVARFTLHAREAAAQDAAVKTALQLSSHEREALEPRCDGSLERLDVVTDDCVERGALGAAALVATGA